MNRTFTTPDRVMLLMSLVPYLKENGPTPLVDLAKVFAVEPGVLRQLIQFLGVAGVPGETQTYQHEDLFDIDWEALELHDLVSLTRIVGVDDTPRFSSIETAALMAGLHALAPMLPDDLRATALTTAEKLARVQPVGKAAQAVSISEDGVHARVTEITSAIAGGTQLTFEYRDENGALSHRTVEPSLLSQSAGRWYLRAYCIDRKACRTFMLDRIRDPQRLLNAARHSHLVGHEPTSLVEGSALTASLRLSRGALLRIADFAPRVVGDVDRGWVRAEVNLTHPAAAVRLVQAAPGEVIIEDPPAARKAVNDWAARALTLSDA